MRTAREDRGISQKELASLLDVSVRSIYNWERDLFRPSEEHQEALCRYVPDLKNILHS
ncbi:helix-turn-helix domain-containing protein [Collibacillus ludicampi]|uniref:helix-turn-helix domain-containing protein n=1 Tax=Collibacillus ludicampi TaxID=2771369 RepID=UPI0034E2D483